MDIQWMSFWFLIIWNLFLMSSRLVILRHKSWNVWNTENREKVLRDERLHREHQELNSKAERFKTQESQRQELLKQNNFTPEENQVRSSKPNNDYLIERNEQDRRKRKREGIADWELGEGSREKTGKRAWYESIECKEEDIVEEVDIPNKIHEDPMAKFCIVSSEAEDKSIQSLKNETRLSSSAVKRLELVENGKNSGNKDTTTTLSSKVNVEELRKSRMKRENEERKKALKLLSFNELGNDTSIKIIQNSKYNHYNQQYNPGQSKKLPYR